MPADSWGVLVDRFDTKEEVQDLAKSIQNILDIKFISSPNKFKIRLVGSKRRNDDRSTK